MPSSDERLSPRSHRFSVERERENRKERERDIYIYIYIYREREIYIYRERERERKREIYVYIYIYIYTHIVFVHCFCCPVQQGREMGDQVAADEAVTNRRQRVSLIPLFGLFIYIYIYDTHTQRVLQAGFRKA